METLLPEWNKTYKPQLTWMQNIQLIQLLNGNASRGATWLSLKLVRLDRPMRTDGTFTTVERKIKALLGTKL
jgi:hypothetical protein